jgi:hypothetical protein
LVVIPAIYISFENSIVFVKNFILHPLRALGLLQEKEAVVPVPLPVVEKKKTTPRPVLETRPVIHLPQKPPPKPPISPIMLPHQPPPLKRDLLLETLPQKYRSLGLIKRQNELLLYLLNYQKITRIEYAEKFGVSIITAARDLKDLLQKGLIKTVGPKAPGRYYELA